MTQPTAYIPSYNFTAYQTAHPSTPLPASNVDAELFAISASITEICINLGLIQRSDGAIANNSIGLAQLQTSLMIGVNAAVNWLTNTAYSATSSVYQGNNVYVCLVSHTSTVFATDLAAGYWQLVLNLDQYVSAASGSATAAAASAAAAALSAVNMTATSVSSQTPGSGAMTFTTQSGKFFNPGAYVQITSNANPTINFMNAQITSYSGTSLVVNVVAFGGSGAHVDWTINVSGGPGATGPTGSPGAGTGDMLKANNLSELANFATARGNLGLGSAALQANSFFAQTANNLSDLANKPTAFANIKQTGTSGATGVLQLATNTEAVAGSDTAKAVTCAGVAAAITAHGGLFTKSYTSAQQVISAGGVLTLAHGLAAIPKLVVFNLLCVSSEFGYTAGQTVPIPTSSGVNGASTTGAGMVLDTTNINIRFSNTGGGGFGPGPVFWLPRFDNGGFANLTNANWALVVSAYA